MHCRGGGGTRVVAFIAFSSQTLRHQYRDREVLSSSGRAGEEDAVASLPQPLGKHQSANKSQGVAIAAVVSHPLHLGRLWKWWDTGKLSKPRTLPTPTACVYPRCGSHMASHCCGPRQVPALMPSRWQIAPGVPMGFLRLWNASSEQRIRGRGDSRLPWVPSQCHGL